MSIYKNLKRFVKTMTCNHNTTWEFYPTEFHCNGSVIQGRMKLVLCWKCGSVINVVNFGQ